MNTENYNIAALSELDRLGQQALDAIWEEESKLHPRHGDIMNIITESEDTEGGAERALQAATTILGEPGNLNSVIEYGIQTVLTSQKRSSAVANYISGRRIAGGV